MYLFIIENGICKPNPETILFEPFKHIWDRDRTVKKETAIKDFTYINFMVSPFTSNPFKDLMNKDERTEKIIKSCFQGNYKPDKKVLDVIKWCEDTYLKDMSLSYKTLISAKVSTDKLNTFLSSVSLTTVNDKGMPLYKPVDITRAIKDLSIQMEAIKKLELTVMEEYKETARTRARAVINPLEE